MQELRRWRELIPHFVMPMSSGETKRLSVAASVSPEFIELTNVAVTNQRALVRGDGATPAEVRDLVDYADAYDPLADELEAFAHFVRHSVTAARNKAANEALTTYSLAQRLAKQPANASLAPYVADMRRALGRTRKLSPPRRKRRRRPGRRHRSRCRRPRRRTSRRDVRPFALSPEAGASQDAPASSSQTKVT